MLRTILARLAGTIFRRSQENRLQEDIQEHLSVLAQAYESRGLTPEEAKLAARREFGAIEPMKESYRDAARFRLLENIWRDLSFAARQCRKNPGLTLLAVASLALGIGANTALFSFVNAILLKRLPVPSPDRLVMLERNAEPTVLSYEQLNFLNANARQVDGLLGRFPIDISVATADRPQWVAAELVTGGYFRTLRVKAARGRLLTQKDLDNADGNPLCVVSHRFWQNELNSDADVIGRTIRINMREYQIIGVSQPGFTGVELQQPVDLQIPATRLIDFMPSFVGMPKFDWKRRLSFFSVLGRLKPNATLVTAATELSQLDRQYAKNNHAKDQWPIQLATGSGGTAGQVALAKPATILLAVSSLVLVIACMNLATLLLARTTARASEFAVRLAIGCSRRRVIAQVMTESALLAVLGAAVGLIVAVGLERAILNFLNRANPGIHQLHVRPDPLVLVFAAGISGVCVLLFGTAPALQAACTAALGSSVGNTGSGTALRRTFVGLQVALSFVVLFAAALLTRTLSKLETIDLHYHPDQIASIDIRPAAGGYAETRALEFYSRVVERVRQVAGIKAAATSLGIGVRGFAPMKLDPSPESQRALDVNIANVSPGYFDTIGTRVLEGRDFNRNDTATSGAVYIINQHLAKAYFHNLDPVGRFLLEDGRKLQVVGVVADVHDQALRDASSDTVYQDANQFLVSSLEVLARCEGPCASILPALRTAIQNMDPNTPILSIQTMQTEINGTLSDQQVLGVLSMLFAILAVLLTGAGLYGIVSYAVTRRTREIGLRVAIGASARSIVELLTRETGVLVLIGAVVGIPSGFAAVTLLKSQLFGISQYDPVSLGVVILCIGATSLSAAIVPLRRALRIAPQQALRVD